MHQTLITYRNKNDFKFGSFIVKTGQAWMEVWGKLKKTGTLSLVHRIEYRHGKGKEYIEITEDEMG